VSFSGWPPAALAFYDELEANNTRAWWLENKATYDDCVKAPFLALSEEIEREFGQLRLFRPNRDTRFAKDKTPYKTAAAAVTEGSGGTHYYISLSAEGLYAGSGYYQFAPDQLERYRVAIADGRRGSAFAKAVETLRKQRYEVGSREAMKRVPRGYDADHARSDLLKLKGIHVGRSFGAPKWMHKPAARDKIVGAWRDAAPVNRWLDRNVGPSTLPPPEPD
jgi:uncharacterized protein (TIGR02453 family)